MLGEPQIPQREPTNLSLDVHLVAEAKKFDIDISRTAEDGIAKAVADEKGAPLEDRES